MTTHPAPACPSCDRPLRRGVDPIYGLCVEWCLACDVMRLASDPLAWFATSTRLSVLNDYADTLIERDDP